MIQRLQTVFLLLAAVVLAVSALLGRPVAAGPAEFPSLSWLIMAGHRVGLAAAFVAVIAVFLYRYRGLQQRTVSLNIILAFLIAVLVWVGAFISGELETIAAGNVELLLAGVGPIIAILFMWLARRRIAADIELIRSMDRIR